MNINETIINRRTIQSFTSDAVPFELIEQAVQMALWAPNHKLTWPMRFYFVGPQARTKMASLQVELKEKKSITPMTEAAKTAARHKFINEGSLLVAAIKKSNDPHQAREDYATLAAGLQNMALFLWAAGYGSKWGTGGLIRAEETYQILSLNPAEVEIAGLFWIGKARIVPPPMPRPAVSHFLSRID